MSNPVDRLLEGPHAAAVLAPALDLAAPEPGADALRHDATFETWDLAFCTTRDVVNVGLGLLGELGLHLPRLPEQTLRELVVAPVVGDCAVIRANAEACRTAAGAAERLAASGARVLVAGSERWSGQAATAWAGGCGTQIARTAAAAEALRVGAVVFEGIAQVCERLTVSVEHGIVALGKALLRLAARLAAKVSPAGWAALVAEVAVRGLDAITDIVRDVELVLGTLRELLGLRDRVAEWVEQVRGEVGRVEGLLGAIA